MNETQLWEWMMAGNYPPGYPDFERLELVSLERRAFATLARDIELVKWQGHGKKDKIVPLKAGTRVRVVMASRFGDVGITDNLEAMHGYSYRTNCIEGEWVENAHADRGLGECAPGAPTFRLEPEGLLLDIEPVEDVRADKVKIAFPEGP